VHFSAIEGNGYRNLEENETVEFDVNQGPKGLQAANVKRLGQAAKGGQAPKGMQAGNKRFG
jgi:hypothetical protein